MFACLLRHSTDDGGFALQRRLARRRGYTSGMRSVADDLRQKDRAAVLKLTPEERIALALRLGERDLEIFCRAQGLDRKEAIRVLQRRRQAGRRPSRCMTEIIG